MTDKPIVDILLCQKFLPEFGGSIRWMYEVYRRWPRPVDVITHDYYAAPPRTPEFPDETIPRPAEGDHVTDDVLRMDRRDIFINNWGLDSVGRVVRYGRMMKAVHERLRANRKALVRVHCIHAVPEAASLVPLKVLYGNRLRVISYAHGEEITACASSRQLRFIMHRAHRIVDCMIVNSSYTQHVAADHIDPAKIVVINPGVEIDEFKQAEAMGRRWREEQGVADRLIVLTVGRLDPRKNLIAVLRAVAELVKQHPELLYLIVGEGRERGKLEAEAENLGVADHVRFLGAVGGDEKIALYGACDVFAMPAIRDGTDVEGFGMVFLEAGACGKPSIAGCEGGQPDAVDDGRTGLIVDGLDQSMVTAALRQLVAEPAERSRIGDAARAHAKRFDWPCVVQRTVEVVDKMDEC